MPDFWLSTIQYVERSVYGFEPLFISSHTTLSLKELLYICSLSCLISGVILKKRVNKKMIKLQTTLFASNAKKITAIKE